MICYRSIQYDFQVLGLDLDYLNFRR